MQLDCIVGARDDSLPRNQLLLGVQMHWRDATHPEVTSMQLRETGATLFSECIGKAIGDLGTLP